MKNAWILLFKKCQKPLSLLHNLLIKAEYLHTECQSILRRHRYLLVKRQRQNDNKNLETLDLNAKEEIFDSLFDC